MDEVKITEEDVMGIMDVFTKVPPFLLKGFVNRRSNLVNKFQSQIKDQKSQLSDEDLAKINKVMHMPVNELQDILYKVYAETGQKQLQILAAPPAEPFISVNLKELKRIFSNGE